MLQLGTAAAAEITLVEKQRNPHSTRLGLLWSNFELMNNQTLRIDTRVEHLKEGAIVNAERFA